MPEASRNRIYQMIADGATAAEIREWAAHDKGAREALHRYFGGADLNDQNVTNVRHGAGYMRWQEQRDEICQVREYTVLANDLAQAAGGGVSGVLVPILGGKLMEVLSSADGRSVDDLARTVLALRDREQKDRALGLRERRVEAVERKALQAEREWQVQTVKLFLEWLDDRKAMEIAESNTSNTEKLRKLVVAMFGKNPLVNQDGD